VAGWAPVAEEAARAGNKPVWDVVEPTWLNGTVHIPMFEVKRMLGHNLSEDEQDILDAGRPTDIDVQSFFTMINRLHHKHDNILLCLCNSGRRSLHAAQLLRSLGYGKALSVAGGFQAWKKLQAPPEASTASTAPAASAATKAA
jgi:rhodanese-related sulfurtransferase